MPNAHDVRVLNSLITTTIDSADGYRAAAEDTTNEQFRKMFIDRANEREAVIAELQQHVREIGGDPETSGSMIAGAHRFFLDMRDALTGSDDKAVVEEVERGEDYIKEKYEVALSDQELSDICRSRVSAAFESVRKGHDQMSDLKSALTNNSNSATPTAY